MHALVISFRHFYVVNMSVVSLELTWKVIEAFGSHTHKCMLFDLFCYKLFLDDQIPRGSHSVSSSVVIINDLPTHIMFLILVLKMSNPCSASLHSQQVLSLCLTSPRLTLLLKCGVNRNDCHTRVCSDLSSASQPN